MNFTYEPMTLDNWRELVRLDPTGMRPAGPPGYWAVDRDNDIQFVSLGGQNGASGKNDLMPDFYVLIWKKKIVHLEASHTSKFEDDKQTINEDVFSIRTCKALEAEADEIRLAIPQALQVTWEGQKSRGRIKLAALHVNLSEIKFF